MRKFNDIKKNVKFNETPETMETMETMEKEAYNAEINSDMSDQVLDNTNYVAESDANLDIPVSEDNASLTLDSEVNKEKKEKTSTFEDAEKATIKKGKILKIVAMMFFVAPFIALIAAALPLAIYGVTEAPSYSFYPFLGVILICFFTIVFMAVCLVKSRKKSSKTLRNITASIVITFFSLTTGFGIVINTFMPDILVTAAQGTLQAVDLFNRGYDQLDTNIKLLRDFVKANILNGNYDPAYSYDVLAEPLRGGDDEDGAIIGYKHELTQEYYSDYKYENVQLMIDGLESHKKDLFNFIYKSHILRDYDYALSPGVGRQALGLALTDITYDLYVKLIDEGFNNKRLEYLREKNYTSMDHDAYLTYDDPLLLLAQQPGRMTVPVILRLLMDNNYTVSQPVFDDEGNIVDYSGGVLYEGYAPEILDEYLATLTEDAAGAFLEGTATTKFEGMTVHPNGWVERPMKWCVLDMDGKIMPVLSGIDLGIIGTIIGSSVVSETVEALLNEGIGQVIEVVANGGKLSLAMYVDDNGLLSIDVVSANETNGVLGYMQQNWLNLNGLLIGFTTLLGTRNSLLIFGAIGLVLVILGGVFLEESLKIRDRKKNNKNEDDENQPEPLKEDELSTNVE